MMPRLMQLTPGSGLPSVRVPRDDMWDLVEYLAIRRTRVRYTFEASAFTVTFLHIDGATAQHLLDDWIASRSLLSRS